MLINNLGFNHIDYKERENNQYEYEILIIVDDIIIGNICSLNQNFLDKFKFDNNVVICNLDIELLSSKLGKNKNKYTPIIPYPSIKRDIAILVSNDVKHEQIVSDIYNSSSDLLKEVNLFDIYLDDSLGSKTKSLAYSLKFQSSKKTLKVEDIDKEIVLILKNLKNNLNALQR
jgi:phenylalanyl-tRNA synthetase beta chain